MITRCYYHYAKLIIRFVIGGGLATLCHWAMMWLLLEQGILAHVATAAGALVGAMVNYVLQYYFTFQSRQTHARAMALYLPTLLVSWSCNAVFFCLLYDFIIAQVAIAQAITTGLVMVVNFLLYKKVVFRGYNS